MTNSTGNRIPSDEEFRKPYFTPGEAADHPYGVLYQGEYETLHDGTAVAVRKHARALAATGLPVVLRSFSNLVVGPNGVPQPVHAAGMHRKVVDEVGELRATRVGTLTPLIKHLVIVDAEHLRGLLLPRGAIDADPAKLISMRQGLLRSTIVYSVWERDRIDAEVVKLLSRVAENWVPCRQNARMLVESGVPARQVRVVPHPYEPTEPLCKLTRRRPKRGRHFYSIGRWEPRKGYHELLGAFLRAFRPGDDATLTIKTGTGQWEGYPGPDNSMEQWLGTPEVRARGWDGHAFKQHVRIIGEVLPPDRLLKLHFDHNIYVCSSHGEAWALPAYDAKLAGNRMVHVAWGGTEDFAAPGDVAIKPVLGPVHPSYKWPADTQWAAFAVDQLVQALQSVQAPESYERPADFEQRFGMEAVGALMADVVLGVAAGVDAKAGAYLRKRRFGRGEE